MLQGPTSSFTLLLKSSLLLANRPTIGVISLTDFVAVVGRTFISELAQNDKVSVVFQKCSSAFHMVML